MKIAIVHDWLVSPGGAENVLSAMLDIFPDADIFSVVDFFDDIHREKYLHGKLTKNTFIQKLPFAKSKYRSYLPLMPFAIEQLNVTNYDVVISSSHAVAKGVMTSSDQLHVCYCHSPIRYAWDMKFKYLKESGLESGLKSILAKFFLHRIKSWDVISSYNVDYFIANSNFIKRRIEKCYRRNAAVIFPNVDVSSFSVVSEKKEFYFTASRLVPYKRIPLIAEAFSTMPNRKLIIIGDGPDRDKLETVIKESPNITYLGYQEFSILKKYMEEAKAFIFAAEEDFGIVPVEAQACGTPVIAFGKGGALDTVIDNKTGIFFREQTIQSIVGAINKFETSRDSLLSASLIRSHAENFSTDIFKQKLYSLIYEKAKSKGIV